MIPLPKSPPQDGTELVRRITVLDKSQEPYATLFREVLQLLGLTQDACDSVPSLEGLIRERRRGFTPLDEWALKWLLRRLGPQSPHADVARASYQSWCLLLKLIPRLRLKVVARLLAEFKVSGILADTTHLLGQLAQEHAEVHQNSKLQEPARMLTNWYDVLPLSTSAPTRKRKRNEAGKSSSDPERIVSRALLHLLASLAELFQHIKLRSSRRPGDQETLAKEQLRSCLKMHPTDAARTLGNLVTSWRLVRSQPEYHCESSEQQSSVHLETFLAIWKARVQLTEQQTEYLHHVGI